jgi:hypothetical protein
VCDSPLAGSPEYGSDGASNSTVITIMDDGNVDHGENDERERAIRPSPARVFSLLSQVGGAKARLRFR